MSQRPSAPAQGARKARGGLGAPPPRLQQVLAVGQLCDESAPVAPAQLGGNLLAETGGAKAVVPAPPTPAPAWDFTSAVGPYQGLPPGHKSEDYTNPIQEGGDDLPTVYVSDFGDRIVCTWKNDFPDGMVTLLPNNKGKTFASSIFGADYVNLRVAHADGKSVLDALDAGVDELASNLRTGRTIHMIASFLAGFEFDVFKLAALQPDELAKYPWVRIMLKTKVVTVLNLKTKDGDILETEEKIYAHLLKNALKGHFFTERSNLEESYEAAIEAVLDELYQIKKEHGAYAKKAAMQFLVSFVLIEALRYLHRLYEAAKRRGRAARLAELDRSLDQQAAELFREADEAAAASKAAAAARAAAEAEEAAAAAREASDEQYYQW